MTEEIKEYPVQDMPGWVRIVDGGNRRYRMPNGETISNAQFYKMRTGRSGPLALPQFASSKIVGNPPIGNPRIGSPVVDSTATPGAATPIEGEYEEEETLVHTTEQPQFSNTQRITPHQKRLAGTRKTPGITKGMVSRAAAGPHYNQQSQYTPPPPEPVAQQPANILDNIEPKSHPSKLGRKIENGATAKELADGLYITFSIVTSIAAMFTKTPDLAMSDIEAKNISIPAGNLIEPTDLNKRFGRMIAESGDWQMLGYALWLYVQRSWTIIQQNRGGGQIQPQQQYQQANAVYNGHASGYSPTAQGATMPMARPSSNIIRPGGSLQG